MRWAGTVKCLVGDFKANDFKAEGEGRLLSTFIRTIDAAVASATKLPLDAVESGKDAGGNTVDNATIEELLTQHVKGDNTRLDGLKDLLDSVTLVHALLLVGVWDGLGAADDNCGRSVLTVMEMSSTRACFMFTARRFIRKWLTRVHSWTQKGALQEGAFGACR